MENENLKYFEEIDLNKIIRNDLGKFSLKNFKPKYEEFLVKLNILDKEYKHINQNLKQKFDNSLNQLKNAIEEISSSNDNQFPEKKEQFKNSFENYYTAFNQHFIYIAINKLFNDGFITNDNILTKIRTVEKEINELNLLKNDIQNKFDEKQKEFDYHVDIKISEIRETSSKISIDTAQQEFKNAIERIKKNIKLWSCISGGLTFSIVTLLIVFYFTSDFKSANYIYHAIYKISIVGFLATLLTYSLKILKSNIHLKEANYHKQVMTNSLKAFVESGSTNEQRDIILIKILESLTNLGNTGLVETSSESNQKMTFEYLTKYLSDNK